MRTRGFKIAGTLLLLMLALSTASASPTVITASETAVITSPDSSESRLLMAFDLPLLQEGQIVYYADLRFELSTVPQLVDFELYEVSTAWSSGSVTWDNPWNTQGGDMRENRMGSWITDKRTADLIKFDITECVKRFGSGTATNYGLIVLTRESSGYVMQSLSQLPHVTIHLGP